MAAWKVKAVEPVGQPQSLMVGMFQVWPRGMMKSSATALPEAVWAPKPKVLAGAVSTDNPLPSTMGPLLL